MSGLWLIDDDAAVVCPAASPQTIRASAKAIKPRHAAPSGVLTGVLGSSDLVADRSRLRRCRRDACPPVLRASSHLDRCWCGGGGWCGSRIRRGCCTADAPQPGRWHAARDSAVLPPHLGCAVGVASHDFARVPRWVAPPPLCLPLPLLLLGRCHGRVEELAPLRGVLLRRAALTLPAAFGHDWIVGRVVTRSCQARVSRRAAVLGCS